MSEPLVPVFDLGGVFLDWNPLYLFRKLFDSEEDAVWFHDTICTLDWHNEFDSGRSFADGVAELVARHPRYWREITAYDVRWCETIVGVNARMVAILDELAEADTPLFAITNFSAEKFVSVVPDFPFLERFDGVVVSGVEKLVKPDPRIFKLFLERYGLAADSCVFIDDSALNVAAAQKVGMSALHFTDADKLRGELIGLGLSLKAAK